MVQGGFQGSKAARDFQSTEVLNLRTKTWRTGTPSPIGNYGAAVVPDGDTFLVVGGDSSSGELTSTMYYDGASETWGLLQDKFEIGRVFSTASGYTFEEMGFMCRDATKDD